MSSKDPIDITPNQNGGVFKSIFMEGEGDEQPLPGSTIKINEIIRLGSVNRLFYRRKFELGRGDLIRAWEIGIPTMKKYEVAIFCCVPEYAVTEECSEECSSISEIQIYCIQLLSFKPKDLSPNRDRGIERYHTIRAGKHDRNLTKEDVVDVHLVGEYEQKIFDERDVILVLNEENETNVISGIKIALLQFNVGETSLIKIKPEYAFGILGCKAWGIPSNATIHYTITLKSIKNCWSLSTEQRMQQAELFKTEADRYFVICEYRLAFRYYVKMQTYLLPDKDLTDGFCEKRKDLQLTSYLKSSEVSLVMQHYFDAYCGASDALEIHPENVKALLYRSKVHSRFFNHDLAAKDLKRCLEIDPANEEAQKLCILHGDTFDEYKIHNFDFINNISINIF